MLVAWLMFRLVQFPRTQHPLHFVVVGRRGYWLVLVGATDGRAVNQELPRPFINSN